MFRWGRGFEERYHSRLVEGVFDTCNGLRNVLLNHTKHGSKSQQIDWVSSGPWFEGWALPGPPAPSGPPPVAPFRPSLLEHGWCLGATLLGVNGHPRSTGRTARFKKV